MQHLNLLTLILFFSFRLFTFGEERDTAMTLLYSGEEQGQLGAHGCGVEQVGGLAHRQTLIAALHTKASAVLNLHIGNLIDATDPNAEWIYQIGLSALAAMETDVMFWVPTNSLCPSKHFGHFTQTTLRWASFVRI